MNAILEKLKQPYTDIKVYYVKGKKVQEVYLTSGNDNRFQFDENHLYMNRAVLQWYTKEKKREYGAHVVYVHPDDFNNEHYLLCSEDLYSSFNAIITLDRDEAYRFLIHQVEKKKRVLNQEIVQIQKQWNQQSN